MILNLVFLFIVKSEKDPWDDLSDEEFPREIEKNYETYAKAVFYLPPILKLQNYPDILRLWRETQNDLTNILFDFTSNEFILAFYNSIGSLVEQIIIKKLTHDEIVDELEKRNFNVSIFVESSENSDNYYDYQDYYGYEECPDDEFTDKLLSKGSKRNMNENTKLLKGLKRKVKYSTQRQRNHEGKSKVLISSIVKERREKKTKEKIEQYKRAKAEIKREEEQILRELEIEKEKNKTKEFSMDL